MECGNMIGGRTEPEGPCCCCCCCCWCCWCCCVWLLYVEGQPFIRKLEMLRHAMGASLGRKRLFSWIATQSIPEHQENVIFYTIWNQRVINSSQKQYSSQEILRHELITSTYVHTIDDIFYHITLLKSYAVAQLFETLSYKSEADGFDSRWGQWTFHWLHSLGCTMALG